MTMDHDRRSEPKDHFLIKTQALIRWAIGQRIVLLIRTKSFPRSANYYCLHSYFHYGLNREKTQKCHILKTTRERST